MTKLLALAAMLLACGPAAAQEPVPCFDYGVFVKTLPERYGEDLVDASIIGPGPARLEYWARADRRSYTMLLVHPGGMACMVNFGGRPVEQGEPS